MASPKRTHKYPDRVDSPLRAMLNDSIPGYRLAELATVGLPSALECRAMLQNARKTHSLTRGHLAYLVGTTVGQIEKWESGARNPTTMARRRINEVCRALDEAESTVSESGTPIANRNVES